MPMLNLTLPIFPFVLAFAVKSLGWQPAAIGFAAAIPYFCNALQPLFVSMLSKRLSIYRLLVLTFWLNALPWFVVAFLDSFGSWRDSAFALILFVATLGNSIAAVAWSASISELVPERIAGKYFGKRNLFFGAWSLVTVFVAGMSAVICHIATNRGSHNSSRSDWQIRFPQHSVQSGNIF